MSEREIQTLDMIFCMHTFRSMHRDALLINYINNYFNNFLYVNITANTIINATIP